MTFIDITKRDDSFAKKLMDHPVKFFCGSLSGKSLFVLGNTHSGPDRKGTEK